MKPCRIGRGLCLLLGATWASGCLPQAAPGIKTDRGVYPELPLPALPKAGGTYIDPTFGTTVMRLTDEADGADCKTVYSYWPTFNRDSTRLIVACNDGPVLINFDPEGFRRLDRSPLYAANAPDGGAPRWDDAIWSGSDPDLLFCHAGLKLWSYDVAEKRYTLLKDFEGLVPPGHLCQMSKSLDDNVFGFSMQDPEWNVTGFLAWRRSEHKVLTNEGLPKEGLDEVQVDKTGRYLVIKTMAQGKGALQDRVAGLETGTVEDLSDNEPDYAPGHSDNGHGTIIGADNWRNCLTFRKLAQPHEFYTVLDLANDWSQDCHISLLADDESRVLLSFYASNDLPSSGAFRNEIVQVATDGSQQVRRLAHHRSVVKEYWDSPRANISRDGRFVAYTSNWGGSGRRDVFILQVPAEP